MSRRVLLGRVKTGRPLFLVLVSVYMLRLVALHNYVAPQHTVATAVDDAPPTSLESRVVVQGDTARTISNSCHEKEDQMYEYCSEFAKNGCSHFRPSGVIRTDQPRTRSASSSPPCKTLWFSGFHEGSGSRCRNKRGGGYRMDYATALASAKLNGFDTLQPVLLLGRRGLNSTQSVSKLRSWARSMGAIVIEIQHVSFEDDIEQWYSGRNGSDNLLNNPGLLQGPFLRLDIPNIVSKHGLFDLPGICPQYALWTDADIIFSSRIGREDMQQLESLMHRRLSKNAPYLMYGREGFADDKAPSNTGVVLYDVERFRELLPRLVQYRNSHPDPKQFITLDQGWLNLYFRDYESHKRQMLPIEWNWKTYWKLQPRGFYDIKVLHFHGLKPERGLWMASDCETDFSSLPVPYHILMNATICCDDLASTATHARAFSDLVQPSFEEVC